MGSTATSAAARSPCSRSSAASHRRPMTWSKWPPAGTSGSAPAMPPSTRCTMVRRGTWRCAIVQRRADGRDHGTRGSLHENHDSRVLGLPLDLRGRDVLPRTGSRPHVREPRHIQRVAPRPRAGRFSYHAEAERHRRPSALGRGFHPRGREPGWEAPHLRSDPDPRPPLLQQDPFTCER